MQLRVPIFEFPPQAEALRSEVRDSIAEELAAGLWQAGGDFASHYNAGFSQRVGTRGWLGMTWPRRYGGHERSMLERLVVTEELLAASAPVAAHWIAARQSGPLLLRYGSEAQRSEFLPQIPSATCPPSVWWNPRSHARANGPRRAFAKRSAEWRPS